MSGSDEQRPARLAQNEILYRDVNERIQDMNQKFQAVASFDGQWICECDDMACATTLTATITEYETVRANPRTFIVAPGHVDPFIEHIVRTNERFAVVEKEGVAGELAELNDTRS